MVSVAKSFDAPIKVYFVHLTLFHKIFVVLYLSLLFADFGLCISFSQLLFPTADATRPFSMLGLGDIVIPGIFIYFLLK